MLMALVIGPPPAYDSPKIHPITEYPPCPAARLPAARLPLAVPLPPVLLPAAPLPAVPLPVGLGNRLAPARPAVAAAARLPRARAVRSGRRARMARASRPGPVRSGLAATRRDRAGRIRIVPRRPLARPRPRAGARPAMPSARQSARGRASTALPAKSGPATTGPGQTGPGQTVRTKIGPGQTNHGQTVRVRIAPAKTDPVKTGCVPMPNSAAAPTARRPRHPRVALAPARLAPVLLAPVRLANVLRLSASAAPARCVRPAAARSPKVPSTCWMPCSRTGRPATACAMPG